MQAMVSLWGVLTGTQRRRLRRTLALMLAGAIAELLTIGALLSLLTLLVNPGQLSADFTAALASLPGDPVIAAAIAFTLAAIVSAAVRLALIWYSTKFALDVGQELAAGIFSRMMRQSYSEHVRRHSSEVLAAIERVQVVVFGILVPLMQGFVATFIASSVIALLLFIDAFATTLAGLFFAGLYALLSLATRRRVRHHSISVAAAGKARIKTVQDGLGGMRDIILDRSQPLFEEKFRRLDARYRRAHAALQFMRTAPRFVVEAAAITAVTLVVVISSFRPGGITDIIPLIGALVLAGQRLMPLIHQIFVGWSFASGNLQPLRDVIALAEAPMAAEETEPAGEELPFRGEIVLDRVGFAYGAKGFALHDVSLSIPRGARLGIAGPTGGGKSTLIDLVIGLLEPTAGAIEVDGRRLDPTTRLGWRRQIAHVPQSIFLLDGTIASNIAFGLPDARIAMDEVRAAAAAACLDEFIDALPQGYRTRVGEQGIRLSGGQRQRLGIARALYKKAPVLILDEATSAVDEETEARILRSIASRPELTIIIVAHRASALAGCDAVVRLEGGRLAEDAVVDGPWRARLSARIPG